MSKYLFLTFLISVTCLSAQKRLPFQNDDLLPPSMREASFKEICNYLDQKFDDTGIEYDDDGRILDNDFIKYNRWKHEWYYRLSAEGDFPGMEYEDNVIEEKMNILSTPLSKSFSEDWKPLGPFERSGLYWGMGKVMAIAFHPTDENTYWVGATKGGIWKTEDGGQSYISIGDNLPYNSVTNIVVDQENPDNILISLGDRTGWWEPSLGIYRTTNGGGNWTPTNFVYDLSNEWTIFDMEAHPQESDFVLVASADGLYMSEDGESFLKLSNGLPSTSYSSLYPRQITYHPTDISTAYVVWFDYWGNESGIYKTTDKGLSWVEITDNDDRNRVNITIATSPADPEKLVAKFDKNEERYVRVSYDRGDTWEDMPNHNDMDGNILYISPQNPDRIYSGYFYIWGSDDSGRTFEKISAWDINNVHVDQWDIKHNPLNNKLYWCNDGGVYSYDESTDVWTELNKTLAITQMYDMSISQSIPGFMLMGSQDNGGAQYNILSEEWTNTNGGDGMTNAINPLNHKIFFTTYVLGLEIYRTTNGWFTSERITNNLPSNYKGEADWLSPFCLNPIRPNEIFVASENIYFSADNGDTWEEIASGIALGNNIKKIEVSPADDKTVYAFSQQMLLESGDYGRSWSINTINTNTISNIDLHPSDPDILWATQGGFSDGQKVHVSNDRGSTWTNISGSLPNIPTYSIIYDPVDNDLYVGTELGMYTSDADNIDWVRMDNNFPLTQVNDLEIQWTERKLYAATYGRGLYELQLENTVTSTEDIDNKTNCFNVVATTDNITVTYTADQVHHINQVYLYDLSGKIVLSKKLNSNREILSTQGIVPGLYIISNISKDKKVCSQKIVIN